MIASSAVLAVAFAVGRRVNTRHRQSGGTSLLALKQRLWSATGAILAIGIWMPLIVGNQGDA